MVEIVGILNITPDSFSDGGKYLSLKSAISQTQKLLQDGADIIDIGAESTRPGAQILSDQDEWQRLEKILPQIIAEVKNFNQKEGKNIQTSIDSYHFSTIKKAYELGIDIINDISGLVNKNIVKFIAKNNITTILMHNLAIHANPNLVINKHLDINREIIKWAEEKISNITQFGVKKEQLIFDPGIGFSKNADQSVQILKNIDTYQALNLPIYIGHSMKSFLDIVNIEGSREQKTIKISQFLAKNKVDYLRVHNVYLHKQALGNQ